MKTVGDKIEKFAVTGVNPGSDQFFDITDTSFEGKWIGVTVKDFIIGCI